MHHQQHIVLSAPCAQASAASTDSQGALDEAVASARLLLPDGTASPAAHDNPMSTHTPSPSPLGAPPQQPSTILHQAPSSPGRLGSPDAPVPLSIAGALPSLTFEEVARLMSTLQGGNPELTMSQLLGDMPLGGFPLRSGAQDTTIGSLFQDSSHPQTTTAIPVCAPAWPGMGGGAGLSLPLLDRPPPLRTANWTAQVCMAGQDVASEACLLWYYVQADDHIVSCCQLL